MNRNLTPIDTKHLVTRLFSSWILISLMNSFLSSNFLELEFCAIESLPFYLLKVLLCFFMLTLLESISPISLDCILLLAGTFGYSIRVLSASNDVYLLFGVCIFSAFVLYFYFSEISQWLPRLTLSKRTFFILILILAISVTGFITVQTISRYCLSRSSTFDMGIFIQMFHNMKENFNMYTSCERNEWLSHSNVHTSVFFYLLLPVYCLFPYAQTLLVLQAGAVLLGFYPLILLCRHYQISRKCTFAFCLIYGLSPATTGGCFYDFHENVFLIPLLLFLFYYYEKKYLFCTLITALLVCSVKEDATLFVLVFGVYLLLGKRNIKYAFPLLGIGSIWMFFAFRHLFIHGQGLMTNHYSNLVCEENGGLLSILQTLLVNPAYLLTQMFQEDKLPFMIAVFLPLTILPFYTKKYSRFILLIPFLFINLLPSYIYQHSIFYQYVFAPYMFLLYLSLMNLSEINKKPRQAILLLCVSFCCYSFVSQISSKSYYWSDYRTNTGRRMSIQKMLSQIPEDASVSANTFFVPQLAQRKTIYMLDSQIVENQHIYETDYAVFDLRNGYADETLSEEIMLYENRGYTTLDEQPELYLILKK